MFKRIFMALKRLFGGKEIGLNKYRKEYVRTISEEEKLHLRELRAKLIMHGLRIKDVSRETGFHNSYVTHVLAGRRSNKKIINYIERLA